MGGGPCAEVVLFSKDATNFNSKRQAHACPAGAQQAVAHSGGPHAEGVHFRKARAVITYHEFTSTSICWSAGAQQAVAHGGGPCSEARRAVGGGAAAGTVRRWPSGWHARRPAGSAAGARTVERVHKMVQKSFAGAAVANQPRLT